MAFPYLWLGLGLNPILVESRGGGGGGSGEREKLKRVMRMTTPTGGGAENNNLWHHKPTTYIFIFIPTQRTSNIALIHTYIQCILQQVGAKSMLLCTNLLE